MRQAHGTRAVPCRARSRRPGRGDAVASSDAARPRAASAIQHAIPRRAEGAPRAAKRASDRAGRGAPRPSSRRCSKNHRSSSAMDGRSGLASSCVQRRSIRVRGLAQVRREPAAGASTRGSARSSSAWRWRNARKSTGDGPRHEVHEDVRAAVVCDADRQLVGEVPDASSRRRRRTSRWGKSSRRDAMPSSVGEVRELVALGREPRARRGCARTASSSIRRSTAAPMGVGFRSGCGARRWPA